MRKVVVLLLSIVFLTGMFGNGNVKAADLTEDAIVYGVEYSKLNVNRPYKQEGDKYKLIVPSAGTVIISCYTEPGKLINIDVNYTNGAKIKNAWVTKNHSKKETYEFAVSLDAGEYEVLIYDTSNQDTDGYYYVTFNYNFDTTTDAKITSPDKGSVKVTAPKGDKINGYEVRYKVTGSKKWITENVETEKTLNKIFEGLTSGKKYTFQVRKYVFDDYGYKYFSNWTKQQKVKVK